MIHCNSEFRAYALIRQITLSASIYTYNKWDNRGSGALITMGEEGVFVTTKECEK